MKYRNAVLKYGFLNQAGDDGDSGGVPANATGTSEEEVQRRIDEAVAGLKNKNHELLGKLKEQGEVLKRFDGIDPDTVRAMLKQFDDDEEAKLIADGKINDVLDKRTERMNAAHKKELQAIQNELAKAQALAAKFKDGHLSSAVQKIATEAGVHKTALDDALLRARTVFEVNDDGEVVAREGEFGQDGKPLTLKEWFDGMRETAPHWFPAPQGGGVGGNHHTPSAVNPWAKATFNLTKQSQLLKENPALAARMMAQAGVKV